MDAPSLSPVSILQYDPEIDNGRGGGVVHCFTACNVLVYKYYSRIFITNQSFTLYVVV